MKWGKSLGKCRVEEFCVELTTDEPVALKSMRLPAFLVAKGTKDLRMVINYKPLNLITRSDKYPLPYITYLYLAARGAKYYSSLDCKSGYWQVPVRKEDQEKLAFITHRGLYNWLVMPFGPKNAPATFSRIMNKLLEPALGKTCELYIDDIIIWGNSLEDHNKNLGTVLQLLTRGPWKFTVWFEDKGKSRKSSSG
eukprot:Protomagalhaensia_wolfi_Nauph_80__958@NODE_1554_length_1472_cov_34_544313_g1207_i0_p1_GENE_NODE_1554_length_1472_cov_34_544313_g1207_i0NODE_1554_length_1472_cov_34_544313_g1207_i0_p1_ORF_typecomplete_len195_score13_43RVT_1/PF00078_27/5_6e17_NODE_1554_length_1472_cov_34_544313_g1207_i08721456